MDVTMIARHCSVPDSIRRQAEARLQRLQRLDGRMQTATVTYSTESGVRQVDIRTAMKGSSPQVGHGTGATFRSALDRALDRIERQVKRGREKRRTFRKRVPTAPEMSVTA